jgi:hypothetical protein
MSRLAPVVAVLFAFAACTTDGGSGSSSGTVRPTPDGGPGPGAGDPGDGGTDPDPHAGLPPIDPACLNQQGSAEECWYEWLKEIGEVSFTPVALGELGAGPWPTTELVTYDASHGLQPPIVGASVDTGQNVYAVSNGALFVRRPGEGRFTRYDRNTNGLRDYRLFSVVGHRPGVAFVGYEGVFAYPPDTLSEEEKANWLEPQAVRRSGDVQRIELAPAGIRAIGYVTHNSNTPVSGRFDHSRSIHELHVPRRGPSAGELFLGTEHGVVRYQGDRLFVDHIHIATVVGGSQRFGPSRAMAVAPNGFLWYGNDFQFGGREWTPRRAEWLEGARWFCPGHSWNAREDRDFYEGMAVTPSGDVYAAGRGHGIVTIDAESIERRRCTRRQVAGVPDVNMRDLVADPDGSIWMGADSGLYRYRPSSGAWTKVPGLEAAVQKLFLDDTVTPRAIYVSHARGLSVYRGP